jgi:hypothetical protein
MSGEAANRKRNRERTRHKRFPHGVCRSLTNVATVDEVVRVKVAMVLIQSAREKRKLERTSKTRFDTRRSKCSSAAEHPLLPCAGAH